MFTVSLWTLLKSKSDCSASLDCLSWDPSGHWIAGIILSSLYGFMGLGITARFGSYVLFNLTTVEDLQRGRPSHCFAVRIDSSELPRPTRGEGGDGENRPGFFWVRYPFGEEPAAEQQQYRQGERRNGREANGAGKEMRYTYFAILQPRPGANVWDRGWLQNWQSIMGKRPWDWVLPIKRSPCLKHDDVSDFKLGKDFEELERAYLPHRYRNGRRIAPLP